MEVKKDKNPKRRIPNRRKLTQLFVDKVTPSEKVDRYWDTEVRPLHLKVEPSGAKSWYGHYRRFGKQQWPRFGPVNGLSLGTAREATRQLNAKLTLDPAYDPQAEKMAYRMQGTIGDLVDRYIADHLASLKSGSQGTFLLRRYVSPTIGKMTATGVQRSDIRTLLNGVTSESTRKQVFANLSGMFNWAIRNDYLAVPANPASGIKQRAQKARERVLSDSELPLFLQGFDEAGLMAARALKIILLTGQRPGETRHLRWQDIDIGEHRFTDDNGRTYTAEGAWWTLAGEPSDDGTWPGTKNGQTHRVWLSKPALQIVEEILDERSPTGRSPYVFAGRADKSISSLDGSMRQICQALGLEKPDKVTPHDLRRTHGTTITSLGFSRDQMNRIQNHKEGGIASVYDRHSYQHEARIIQETVGERIRVLVGDNVSEKIVAIGRQPCSL